MVESGVTACCRLCPLLLRIGGGGSSGDTAVDTVEAALECAGRCNRVARMASQSSVLLSFLSRRNNCSAT